MDVIITGHVEPEEATAYGAYKYIGRIRQRDGYVVLFREPVSLCSPFLRRGPDPLARLTLEMLGSVVPFSVVTVSFFFKSFTFAVCILTHPPVS